MYPALRVPVIAAAALLLGGCYQAPRDAYRLAETREAYASETFGEVVFSRIADNVVMHTSTLDLPGMGPVRSNGLIVIAGQRSILVDTAWSDAQTRNILDYAADVLGAPVGDAIVTHAHQDKMGGIGALRAAGVTSWAHPLTNSEAIAQEMLPADRALAFDNGWAIGPAQNRLAPLAIHYPGGGHTSDNIAIGVTGTNIAFGGCLIKGRDAKTLGNLADADVANYASAARSFGAAFPAADTILVSHSPPQDRRAIAHTIALAERL
ncbi:MBL fold metallo-hydrolase [Pseudopontixanthobacter vadosimaris]|uniref:MBL fold metallo-hydrolase n=1 Tax=Pseudopontixanthobacter vadosimaris TaxID=2726450 RepID=UPI001F11463E|nr:MBL fold metallo-hydrolase [Pseudopontixanthobacter vadosimaris]